MFDEKYIMTGIVSILVIAAWQKPDFYVEQLSSKVTFTVFACILLFAAWDISLTIAVTNLPQDLESNLKEVIIDSIKKSQVPTTWHIFTVLLGVGGTVLEWLASSMLRHEKKKSRQLSG